MGIYFTGAGAATTAGKTHEEMINIQKTRPESNSIQSHPLRSGIFISYLQSYEKKKYNFA